jgi:hypothetical protein
MTSFTHGTAPTQYAEGGGGVGGGHGARVGDQWPVGSAGLGREHVEANAGEVPDRTPVERLTMARTAIPRRYR